MRESKIKIRLLQLVKFLGASVAVIFILVCCLLVWMGWGSTPPKQADLYSRFSNYHTEYEQLRSMFMEDKLATVGEYGEQYARKRYIWTTASEAGISNERSKSYMAVMSKINAKRIDMLDDGSVSISMESWGMANKGWRMNLV